MSDCRSGNSVAEIQHAFLKFRRKVQFYYIAPKFFKLKKLLASIFNIKTVQFVDSSEVDRHYSFSDKMLANDIFIEYFTIDILESEENEEIEDEQIEDDTEDPEYGSQLSVVMKHKSKYYQFLMFHDTFEIGFPVMLLQTIIFLVKLIEETEASQLIEHLTSISSDPLIPHDIPEKEFRDVANKMLKLKIQTIHNLIQEDKADLN